MTTKHTDKQGRPVRRTGKPGRPKVDRRLNNSGKIGNKGGGRKEWQPKQNMIDDRVRNITRRQTIEEAWEEARAMVRHMSAIGYPVAVMGRFLTPAINDETTLKKHFAWEIENGQKQADMNVAGVAYRMAISGRHETSTWRWLERRVEGFQPKQDINIRTPIPFTLIPGDV